MLWFPHVGRRQMVTVLATGHRVITTYWSASVLFVFGFAFRYAHYLDVAGPGAKPLSDMEIRALIPGGRIPRPSLWRRYGLLVFIALIVAFIWWVKATEG